MATSTAKIWHFSDRVPAIQQVGRLPGHMLISKFYRKYRSGSAILIRLIGSQAFQQALAEFWEVERRKFFKNFLLLSCQIKTPSFNR
jgi:hypothetical protein